MRQPSMVKHSALARCPVCDSAIDDETQPYRNWVWRDNRIFQSLELAHCSVCGFAFAVPEPSPQDINRFYQSAYRGKPSHEYVNFARRPSFRSLDYRTVAQLSLATGFCNFNDGDVFLDIGPGTGESFRMASATLPNPKIVGIELAAGAKNYYRRFFGAEVHDSLAQFTESGQRAKILLMSHSLEHYRVGDLDDLFRELGAALADEGVLLLEVPHVELRKNGQLRGNDSPHLLFFGETSLRMLLERNGFSVPFIRPTAQRFEPGNNRDTPVAVGTAARVLARWGRAVRLALPSVLLRTLLGAYHALFPASTLSRLDVFMYGCDRTCLRAVARKGGLPRSADAPLSSLSRATH